jgi:hypothetical protein
MEVSSVRCTWLIALLVLIAACGGGNDEANNDAADETTSSAGSETTESDAGSTDASEEALGLPEWWPSGMPVPEGLSIESLVADGVESVYRELTGSVPRDDPASAVSGYAGALDSAGFEVEAVNTEQGVVVASRDDVPTAQFLIFELDGGLGYVATFTGGVGTAAPADSRTATGTAIGSATVGDRQFNVTDGDCELTETVYRFTSTGDVAMGLIVDVGPPPRLQAAGILLAGGDALEDWFVVGDEPIQVDVWSSGFSIVGSGRDLQAGQDAPSTPISFSVECGV